MKAKFAIVRHTGKHELNSEFMTHFCKCEDVVMLRPDLSNKRRNKVKYKSVIESNWTMFDTEDLLDFESKLRKSFSLLKPRITWKQNGDIILVKEQVFMFTNDANASYISLMKDEQTEFHPFELTKGIIEKFEKFSEAIDTATMLLDPYVKNQKLRNAALSRSRFNFDDEGRQFLLNKAADIENQIIQYYKFMFRSLYCFLEKKAFVGWK